MKPPKYTNAEIIYAGKRLKEAGKNVNANSIKMELGGVRIPANVTGHSGDRDRFAHGLHAGTGFVL